MRRKFIMYSWGHVFYFVICNFMIIYENVLKAFKGSDPPQKILVEDVVGLSLSAQQGCPWCLLGSRETANGALHRR